MKKWALAILYVLFIYLTLGVVPAPLAFLRSHGVLRATLLTLEIACFASLVALVIKRSPRSYWRYVCLVAIFPIYYLLAQRTSSPEEEIHFLEYGFVGVFFLRALQIHFGLNWKSFLIALILASGAGWLDEIIQGHLPNRHYDVKDIFLNVVSSGLGLLVYFILPHKRTDG